MTDTPTRETLDRRQAIWAHRPGLDYDEVIAQADAELADEQAADAVRQEKSADIGRAMDAMFACGACGTSVTGRALCPDCARVEAAILAERSAALPVPGRGDRKAAVAAWMERLGR